jgi:hypothetical protein
MRDIRGDLQDRASFLEEQISTAQAQFEKRLEHLNQEHQAKIVDLESALEAVTTLMEREYQMLSTAPAQDERPRQVPAAAAERRPTPEQYRRPQEPEPQRRTAAEAEPPRRPAAEAEPPYRLAAEDEYRGRPEREAYRQPPRAEIQPQRVPHAAEAEPQPQHRPAAERLHEQDQEPRPAAPQVYRGAPATSAHEGGRPADRQSQAPQQPPLADFLIRKLSEMGAMSLDELCHLAVREGYFADGEIADRSVYVTLMNVAKAGFIRQQPNGTFAPATVMDTIRLRRAI